MWHIIVLNEMVVQVKICDYSFIVGNNVVEMCRSYQSQTTYTSQNTKLSNKYIQTVAASVARCSSTFIENYLTADLVKEFGVVNVY